MVEELTADDGLRVIDAGLCGRRVGDRPECGVCFQTLCERSSAGIFIAQGNGIKYVNSALARMLACAPVSLNDTSPLELFHPDDRAHLEEGMRRCENGEVESCFYKTRCLRSDGDTVYVKLLGSRLKFGGSPALMGTMVDISDGARAEHELEERLRFEKLLADLSARFVNVSCDHVNSLIGDSLKMLVESLGHDRSTVAEFVTSHERATVTHSYTAPGIEPFPLGEISDDLLPWYLHQLRDGEIVIFRRLGDLPPEAAKERELCKAQGIKSNITIPLKAGGAVIGAIAFSSLTHNGYWNQGIVSRLQTIGEVFANALLHKRDREAVRAALAESEELRARLAQENVYLREQVTRKHQHGRIIGESRSLKKTLAEVEHVAGTDTPVLVLGETGTGKELLAQSIHELSPRKERPMVIVNCASLPVTLIESELFGREAGAYTGAASAQVGRFEVADGSTLFLDEVGEFPTELQAKLLRVLQDGRFERLGSATSMRVNVRIIAATNRDLEQAMWDGKFRADLYHRLNVFPIHVPPLRERREDIPLLIWHFVEIFGRRMGKTVNRIPRKTIKQLQQYSWPGNVRELSNVLERAMILTQGDSLFVDMSAMRPGRQRSSLTLDEGMREQILSVLQRTGWRIRGDGGAAEVLAIKPTTLESRMAKLGIKRPKPTSDNS